MHAPIDLGLDVMKTVAPSSRKNAVGASTATQICKNMEKAYARHPELKTDIVLAGMFLLVSQAASVNIIKTEIIPLLAQTIERLS